MSQIVSPFAAAQSSAERRRKPRFFGQTRVGFAIPGFVAYTALVLVPLILSLYYSFTNRNLLFGNEHFVGLANYFQLFSSSTFLGSFAFTGALTVATFIGVNVFGLAVALLLDKVGRVFFAMRMLFFIPIALSGVVVAFIWSTILTDNGLLNSALRAIGLNHLALSWLGTPLTSQGSVIFVTGWQEMGLCIVIYLAGLQTVPRELLDASKIDGCGWFASFRNVTWPLLAPSLTINSTLLLINGFKSFDIPTVMTGTGPGGSTSTIATEVIRVGFTLDQVGVASAMAIVMLATVAIVTVVVVGILQRREVSS